MDTGNERLVRNALWGNALFSLLCGTVLIVFSGPASAFSDALGPLEFALLGASLLPFAFAVAFSARRRPLKPVHVLVISSMDLAWVIATIILGAVWPTLFTPQGWLAAALVALAVDTFCLLQLFGLRRLSLNPKRHGGEGRNVMSVERIISVSPARAWDVMGDVDGYAAYAPNITFSRIVDGQGEGMLRECGAGDARWTERATLWDEGRAYAFRVDTTAPDYPYPFKLLGGHWELAAVEGGTRVRMRFDVTMKGGLLGDVLFAVALLPKFQATLEELLDNWEVAMCPGIKGLVQA